MCTKICPPIYGDISSSSELDHFFGYEEADILMHVLSHDETEALSSSFGTSFYARTKAISKGKSRVHPAICPTATRPTNLRSAGYRDWARNIGQGQRRCLDLCASQLRPASASSAALTSNIDTHSVMRLVLYARVKRACEVAFSGLRKLTCYAVKQNLCKLVITGSGRICTGIDCILFL